MFGESGFFRIVWRFNALVLAVIGLVLVIGAIGGAVLWSVESIWPHSLGKFVQQDKPAHLKYVFTLRSFGGQPGLFEPTYGEIHYNPAARVERFTLFALERRIGDSSDEAQEGVLDSKISSIGRVKYDAIWSNILAVDSLHGGSHWLFDNVSLSITGTEALYAQPVSEPTEHNGPQPEAMVFEVGKAASDNTTVGTRSLYYYRPGDAQATRLLTADLFVKTTQVGPDKYLVTYLRDSKYVAVTYSVPSFVVLTEETLPSVPSPTPVP